MPDEFDGKGRKYLGMYRGVVVDNADPKKAGRCLIAVDGVTPDEGGAWAWPIGWPGAGSSQRGVYAPPPTGSDVVVWFEMGDIDHPYYMGGNPGYEEVPPEVADASAEDAPLVHAWETERFRFKIDCRPGHEECHLQDKVTGDVIELDGVNKAVKIKGTGAVQILAEGSVQIDSLYANVRIAGREVIKNGLPIK